MRNLRDQCRGAELLTGVYGGAEPSISGNRVRGYQSPSANEAGYIDESFIMNNLALRYRIEGPTRSVLSLDDVDEFAFPYSNFHGLGWEASTEWKGL